jgi:chromosome partitioning protein
VPENTPVHKIKSASRYKIQSAARLLEMTQPYIRRLEKEAQIELEATEKGSRLFSPKNLFDLASYNHRKQKEPSQQKIVVVYAPKGGVGKTTISSNLGCIFSLMGFKTLLIDLDFQTNLTLAFGYDSDRDEQDIAELGLSADDIVNYTFADLVREDISSPSLSSVIKKPYGENGPHIIPSDVNLDELNNYLMLQKLSQGSRKRNIAEWVSFARSGKDPDTDIRQYDFILFDASPQKGLMIEGALLAADYVISPVSLDNFSRKGLSYLSDMLHRMREQYSRNPELVLLPNFYDTRKLRVGKQISLLSQDYEKNLIANTIRQSEDFPKTLSNPDENIPLVLAKPAADAVGDLFTVAKALLERMGVRNNG